jgi:hypothetical protein
MGYRALGRNAMNRTPSLPTAGVELPDRRTVADFAYVAYFALLLLAPLALPPALAETSGLAYADALMRVLPVVGLGYVVGLAALLRPV